MLDKHRFIWNAGTGSVNVWLPAVGMEKYFIVVRYEDVDPSGQIHEKVRLLINPDEYPLMLEYFRNIPESTKAIEKTSQRKIEFKKLDLFTDKDALR
jgi:hypothetical protein